MARKKIKIKVNGIEISGSYFDIKNLETVYTLAAIQQRTEGHLIIHQKYLDAALLINHQLADTLEDMTD